MFCIFNIDIGFVTRYREIYETRFIPALTEYRDYLANAYEGRDLIGVSGNVDGAACYAASVRYWSSMSIDPLDIHRAGLSHLFQLVAL